MSIAEKLTKIAENEQKVYEAGKTAEWNEFWDKFQNYGNRNQYERAFLRWSKDNFYPKHNFNISSAFINMFHYFGVFDSEPYLDLSARLEECGVSINWDNAAGSNAYVFTNANVSRLPYMKLARQTSINYTFDGCKMETVDKLEIGTSGTQTFGGAFRNCDRLKNIKMTGVIGRNIDFSYSPLTVESMKSIISCLKDYSGTDEADLYKVSFNEDCWNNLEADSASPTGGTWQDYVADLGWLT